MLTSETLIKIMANGISQGLWKRFSHVYNVETSGTKHIDLGITECRIGWVVDCSVVSKLTLARAAIISNGDNKEVMKWLFLAQAAELMNSLMI